MDWYRRWHDFDNDAKFHTIARKTGHHVCFVKAVWGSLETYASLNEDRGSIAGINIENIATTNNLDESVVEEIINAFKDPNRKMISEDRFSNWKKRQPESDAKGDYTSTERSRRFRERKREETEKKQEEDGNATVMQRVCNGSDTDTDTEVITTLQSARDGFQKTVEVIREVADHLMLKDLSPIHAWLNSGWDVDQDIIPTIRRLCAAKGAKNINTLSFFRDAIADAYASRTGPMPDGNATKPAEIQQSYIIRLQKKPQLDAEESAILAHWENQQKAKAKALIPGAPKPEHKPPEEEYKWLKNLEKKGIPLSKDQKDFLAKHQPEHAT